MSNEANTCRKYVEPKLKDAGWETNPHDYTEQYYFTDGKICPKNKLKPRGKRKFVDCLLLDNADFPLAVVEAKQKLKTPDEGINQAKEYAQILGVKFAYSTNGTGIVEYDFTTHLQSDAIASDSESALETINQCQVFSQRSKPDCRMQQIFDFVRHKNTKARVKEAIKCEFNHRCAYCGSKSKRLTLDHVLASSKGGIDSWRNLVPACAKCNGSKGSKNLTDWYIVSLPCYSEERLQQILNRYSVKSGAFPPLCVKGFASLV